ncbi:MAG: ROK family transcriptional regulator [Eubacteriales bacterium]|nr:ROK family transcriptional regulator [Eubacteriales bacterium]
MSRAELSDKIGLTRAAVTVIIEDMIRSGVISEAGKSNTSSGRKPVILDINPDGAFAFGVDITREGCYIGLVDIKGNLRDKEGFLFGGSDKADGSLEKIAESINRIISRNNIGRGRIRGAGISAPGPLDVFQGVILNPPNFDEWHNIRMNDFFMSRFSFAVNLENNANAYALYEKNYGRGAKFNSFVLIAVTTGVGAGIVLNQQLYRGADGFGSEIGHTSIDFDGPECDCGNKGCLELYSSVPSILKYAGTCGISVSGWQEIADKAEKGDKGCIELIRREAGYLSAGIINCINLLETEAIILSGDISYKPEILVEKIRKETEGKVITRGLHNVSIFGGSKIEDLNIVSAASIVFDRMFCNI